MQFITEVNTIAVDNFNIGYSYNIRFTDDTLKTLVCIGKGIDFVMFQDKYPDLLWSLTMTTAATVSEIDVWSGGTTNYNDLSNKPQINSHTLFGNMSSSDLGLVSESELEDYVTETALETALGDYVTATSLETTLDDYVTETALETTLGDYVTETALETALGDYVTDSDLTTALSDKQDTLTTAQQTAVDSGITSTLVGQISTNETNISTFHKEAGTDIYFSEIEPTGTITDGSYWISTTATKIYHASANVFDELYTGVNENWIYYPINVGSGNYTASSTAPKITGYGALICLLSGTATAGASTNTNGVWDGQARTVTANNGYITIAYRTSTDDSPVNYDTMVNAGDTAAAYEPYGGTWQ